MSDIKLYVMMGLPGSGKSTEADRLKSEMSSMTTHVLHVDELRSSFRYGKNATLRRMIDGELSRVCHKLHHVILDGPVFTNEDLFQAITAAAPSFHHVKVIVYHWDEDRDTCLKNDGGRRDVSSATTIMHAPYENVNVDELNERIKEWDAEITKVVEKRVCLKPGWQRNFRHSGLWISEDMKLRSDKWCTGGAVGNCWNSSLSPVSPDKALNFTELDKMLIHLAPNLTFLQYKIINDTCVSQEESYDRDYYGGGTSYLNWVCDLKELHEKLVEFGYVED